MGCFDTVRLPCPQCGKIYEAQSKGGSCGSFTYEFEYAPASVIGDISWPGDIFVCAGCKTKFQLKTKHWIEEVI